jgi:hypothetical protein
MASPLILTRVIPSEKEMAPVKMSAVISPTENPATAMQFSTAPLFCTTDLQKSYDWCCGTALVSKMRMGIPLFYLNADPNPELGSQINADPFGSGSGLDFKVTESWIFK